MKQWIGKIQDDVKTVSLTMLLVLNLFGIVMAVSAVATALVLLEVDGGFLYGDGHIGAGGALVFIYTVCIVIAVSMAVTMRTIFIHPMQKLVRSMNELAAGNFDVRIEQEKGYRPTEVRAFVDSFNKAAEESYITPTAIIKQINLLEDSLGVKLFERTRRGLTLTKAGRSMYQDAKYIIQYCHDSVIRARNAMQEDSNVIRIGSSPMTPAQLLMELWSKVQTICPDIKFQIVPFENTPENAREILANLGTNIDVVGGIFDETMLHLRKCAGLELVRRPFYCAVSIHHKLAAKDRLQITDLYGENLLLMHRGWSHYVDELRDDLWQHHPQVNIVDFEFYSMDIFNRCENTNDVLLAIPGWANVHPLLKVIPVDWDYGIPYGILHSPNPTPAVQRFLDAAKIASKELYR